MLFTRLRDFLAKLRTTCARMPIFSDRRAVTSVEYGMIALIIIIAVVVGVNKIGTELTPTFNSVSSEL